MSNTIMLPHNLTSIDNNASDIINASKHFNTVLIDKFQRNRNIDDPAFTILICMYGVLILFGAAGNSLVVMAVARKPTMRTARNLFIVNLAISDLLLCLVTMPLTLVEILTKFWPLGRHAFLCKMIGTLQATSIFVSTISITAIALDRYQVIVYPTRVNLQFMGAILVLTAMWLFALLLASPMFLFKHLIHHDINLHSYGIDLVAYCIEVWPIQHGRAYYSAFTLFVQYLMPILIVSAAYLRIYYKLRNRIPIGVVVTAQPIPSNNGSTIGAQNLMNSRAAVRGRRMRRTNCLLISIAIIFGVSWLPLNFFNLFADIYLTNIPITEEMLVIYAVCHMIGMSSSCSNPLLYGWLNENFRKEFKEILCRDNPSRSSSTVAGYSERRNDGSGQGPEIIQVGTIGVSNKKHKRKHLVDPGITENFMSTEMTVLMR